MDIDKEKLNKLLEKDDTIVMGKWYPTKLEYDIRVKGGIDEKYKEE